MSLAVSYSPEAKETLSSVCNFILEKFGLRAMNKFVAKAERTIALIAEHPLMFKQSEIDKDVRTGLITKQCSLFYRVTDTSVELLFFWDNRQEPIFPY